MKGEQYADPSRGVDRGGNVRVRTALRSRVARSREPVAIAYAVARRGATDGRPEGLSQANVRTVVPDQVAPRLEFEEFFRAEYPGLVRAFYVLTADRTEAEELAQEAMARAYERWERVEAMESPVGYLYRIGVNLNRHRLRHLAVRARRLVAMSRDAESEQTPEVRREITEAIASLSRGQREAFVLVEWLGLNAEEAGRLLGIAPASVRSRVHRGKAVLRDRLSEEGGGSWTT